MSKKNLKTRTDVQLWMHHEVNELIGFASEHAGKEGIKYVASELKRLSKSILKDKSK